MYDDNDTEAVPSAAEQQEAHRLWREAVARMVEGQS